MEVRFHDWGGEYVLADARQKGRTFHPVPEAAAEACLRRWARGEPQRGHLRRFAAALFGPGPLVHVSDEELIRGLRLRLASGPRLWLYRVERPLPSGGAVGHGRDRNVVVADAGAVAERILPCSFEKAIIKCAHMPDVREKAGKRTLSEATFWRAGGLERTDLPRPPSGRDREYPDVIEVVASHLEHGADEMSIELRGGPGYTCARHHPIVTIVDSDRKQQQFRGQTHVKWNALCRALPPPTPAYLNPFELIVYHFFPDQAVNLYQIEVETCGIHKDGSRDYGRLSKKVRAYPFDTYAVSLELPALGKITHEQAAHRRADGAVVRSTKDSSERNLVRAKSDSFEHEESLSEGKRSSTDTWETRGRDSSLKVKTEKELGDENESSRGTTFEEDKNPIDRPMPAITAGFSFTRNGADIGATATVGQLINAIRNRERELTSVMNFIKDFQPQVGWKFVFELELFKGKVDFGWGYKEWTDQTVFPWWKLEVDLTLFHLSLELSFGVDVKAGPLGVTLLVFGNLETEAKASVSKEATPSDPAPLELGVDAKGTGALGVRAALGDTWASIEGKLTCEFPFEAKCECSSKEPFHIDWKLDYTGIKGVLVFTTKHCGSFQREERLGNGWAAPKTGRFPGGDPDLKPLQGRNGPIAA